MFTCTRSPPRPSLGKYPAGYPPRSVQDKDRDAHPSVVDVGEKQASIPGTVDSTAGVPTTWARVRDNSLGPPNTTDRS